MLTTTSANLGNMLSMAVASLFLPFLPLLAGQILLNNFLSDIELVIALVVRAIPYLPYAGVLGFVPLPASLLGLVAAITALYVLAAELTKRWFYRAGRAARAPLA